MKKIWTIWKFAIGSFDDETTERYDNHVAVIRTIVVLTNVVCALLIMANIIKNW